MPIMNLAWRFVCLTKVLGAGLLAPDAPEVTRFLLAATLAPQTLGFYATDDATYRTLPAALKVKLITPPQEFSWHRTHCDLRSATALFSKLYICMQGIESQRLRRLAEHADPSGRRAHDNVTVSDAIVR